MPVKFAVAFIHQAVVFALPRMCNVLIARKWATWLKYAVAVLRKMDTIRVLSPRDAGLNVLRVRANLWQFNRMRIFSL
jgi:hypothetical protein